LKGEDEQKLSRVLQIELEHENYITEIGNNGEDALQLIREKEWDLVLLDIMLLGLSGIEVLLKIRRAEIQTQIILLTASDAVHDKVCCFDLRVIDSVIKTFPI